MRKKVEDSSGGISSWDEKQQQKKEEEEEKARSFGEIVKQVYREFAKESTIHGIKYTMQAKTKLEKALWLMVVVVSLVFAIGLAGKFYERHESANMRTTVVTNQFPSLKLPIPAVTVCQGDLVTFKKLSLFTEGKYNLAMPSGLTYSDFLEGLNYLREIIYPMNQYAEELNKLQRILDLNRLSLIQLLELVSPSCDDILLFCAYEGRSELCDKLFETTVTAYGICCSFNDASHRRRRGTPLNQNLFSINFGTRYVLSVLLRSYEQNQTTAAITYGDGYKVIIHERYTLPGPNALEFMAGYALETIVGLRGTYLTSSPEILNLAPDKRDCKISRTDELYRAENCYVHCRNEAAFERCGCLPFHVIDAKPNEELCNLTAIPCLARVNSEIYSLLLNDPRCSCLPDCEAIKYTISLTSEPFEAAHFKPGKFYEKSLEYPNSTALHITFAGQGAVLERKELVLSWINLVSSLGGVFSLFLGCSFISIIEIVYFFIQLLKKLIAKYRSDSSVINLN